MLEHTLTEDEVLRLYDRLFDWRTIDAVGYISVIHHDPFVYMSVVSTDEGSEVHVVYEDERIYDNDGLFAEKLFHDVNKMCGAVLTDMRKQKQKEGVAFVREYLQKEV